MDADLSYGLLDHLLGSRSKHETPCPICSDMRQAHHRKLPCFGLYRKNADQIVFNCMHCGIAGVRTDGWRGQDKVESHPVETKPPEDYGAYARNLWAESLPPAGTDTERYWLHRGLELPIPPTIRHLPGMMIAVAGPAILRGDEWHPPERVFAVQRTFLEPGGLGRKAKKALGPMKGLPIVVHVNPESLALVVGEGIENVHALAREMDVDGWAVTGKTFFQHIEPAVPAWVETVTIIKDEEGAMPDIEKLGRALVRRGIEVRIAEGSMADA